MANTTYKLLGQISVTSNAIANLYVTPASNSAIVSTITISNHHVTDSVNYHIIVRPINETLNAKHYIANSQSLLPSEMKTIKGSVTMPENTILGVRANADTISFNAYGAEIN
jgi:hypothetical protein